MLLPCAHRPRLTLLLTTALAVPAAADDAALREQALGLFEPIPEAPDPAPDPAQVELGKMLLFEPRLSEAHNISRNTCHNLGTGGAVNGGARTGQWAAQDLAT